MWAKKGFILHLVTVTKPGPVTHRLTLAKKFFEKHQEIPALLLDGEDPMQIKAFQRLMKKLFHILRVSVDMYRYNLYYKYIVYRLKYCHPISKIAHFSHWYFANYQLELLYSITVDVLLLYYY